jgi:hypothetical protein
MPVMSAEKQASAEVLMANARATEAKEARF